MLHLLTHTNLSIRTGVYDWVLDNDNDGFLCTSTNSFQTYHQFLAEQASFTENQVMALGGYILMLYSDIKSQKPGGQWSTDYTI